MFCTYDTYLINFRSGPRSRLPANLNFVANQARECHDELLVGAGQLSSKSVQGQSTSSGLRPTAIYDAARGRPQRAEIPKFGSKFHAWIGPDTFCNFPRSLCSNSGLLSFPAKAIFGGRSGRDHHSERRPGAPWRREQCPSKSAQPESASARFGPRGPIDERTSETPPAPDLRSHPPPDHPPDRPTVGPPGNPSARTTDRPSDRPACRDGKSQSESENDVAQTVSDSFFWGGSRGGIDKRGTESGQRVARNLAAPPRAWTSAKSHSNRHNLAQRGRLCESSCAGGTYVRPNPRLVGPAPADTTGLRARFPAPPGRPQAAPKCGLYSKIHNAGRPHPPTSAKAAHARTSAKAHIAPAPAPNGSPPRPTSLPISSCQHTALRRHAALSANTCTDTPQAMSTLWPPVTKKRR